MPDTDEGNGNRGLCLFLKRFWAKRHTLDVRVVPLGEKKGTSLVRKGTG